MNVLCINVTKYRLLDVVNKLSSADMAHKFIFVKFACLDPRALLTEWNVSSWRRQHNKMVWSAIAMLVWLVKSAL